MSSRRRRSSRAPRKTLPEELFGVVWARRLRIAIPSCALALLLAACVIFVLWSQTIGSFLLASGLGLALMWFFLRRGDPVAARQALFRLRPQIIGLGAVLVLAGLVTFAVADQDVGLLLVLLGAAALMLPLISVKQETLAGPLDGPTFGDTPPYGD